MIFKSHCLYYLSISHLCVWDFKISYAVCHLYVALCKGSASTISYICLGQITHTLFFYICRVILNCFTSIRISTKTFFLIAKMLFLNTRLKCWGKFSRNLRKLDFQTYFAFVQYIVNTCRKFCIRAWLNC